MNGLALSSALAALLAAAPAQAQAPAPEAAPAAAAATEAKGADAAPASSRKISLDDEFLVEGQLEKPSAFYVFRRSDIDYDWARLDARFSPLVLESVQDPLF